MKVNNYKRIVKEDFEEENRGLIERLGYSINSVMEQLVNLLNKNITVEDNLQQEIKTIEITTSVNSPTTPKESTKFKNNLTNTIKGVLVISVENLTNTNSIPTSAVQVFFSENSKIVTVSGVTGLTANNKYRIKLLTIGG